MVTRDEQGPHEERPAADLLPAVYDELRRPAAALTHQLRPGQTLQATALVHEAYLRLVGDADPGWQGRRHFFGAAARAMRQILIELAPASAEASCDLGHALPARGDFAEALAAFQRGHELGSQRKDWKHPSAQWVRYYEQLSERAAVLRW
jgi:hypothetical protein